MSVVNFVYNEKVVNFILMMHKKEVKKRNKGEKIG
jgi:hypothetical protein